MLWGGRWQERSPAIPGIDEARSAEYRIPSDNLPPTATDSAAIDLGAPYQTHTVSRRWAMRASQPARMWLIALVGTYSRVWLTVEMAKRHDEHLLCRRHAAVAAQLLS